MVRAFFAVDVKDESTVRSLVSFQNELLRASNGGLKPVEPENFHITLLFLGELQESEVSLAVEALESISSEPFEISLSGAGYFPGGGRVNVVWVGVKGGAEPLRNLHSQLRKKLTSLRLENEKFVPHLTICRVKFVKNKASLLETIAKHASTFFGSQRVESVALKKSVLTSSGPVYFDLAVHKF